MNEQALKYLINEVSSYNGILDPDKVQRIYPLLKTQCLNTHRGEIITKIYKVKPIYTGAFLDIFDRIYDDERSEIMNGLMARAHPYIRITFIGYKLTFTRESPQVENDVKDYTAEYIPVKLNVHYVDGIISFKLYDFDNNEININNGYITGDLIITTEGDQLEE